MLQFEIPQSIYNKKISSAELSIEADGQLMGGELSVYSLSKKWDISELNYIDLESDTSIITQKTVYGTDGKISIDLSEYISDLVEKKKPLYGFILGFRKHVNFFDDDDERPTQDTLGNLIRQTGSDINDCDTLKLWTKNTPKYSSIGDITLHNLIVYKCISIWCTVNGFTPGTDRGKLAWDTCGTCIPREINIHSSKSQEGMAPQLSITLDGNTSIFKTAGKFNHQEILLKDNKISIPDSYGKSKYFIANIQGRIIKEGITNARKIDISSLANGIYSFNIPSHNSRFSFVKQ